MQFPTAVKQRVLLVTSRCVKNPFAEQDVRLDDVVMLIRRYGVKIPASKKRKAPEILVICVLHHRRAQKPGDLGGLMWELMFSSQQPLDPAYVWDIAELFLKPAEMEDMMFTTMDGKNANKIQLMAPYMPEISELREFEGLVRMDTLVESFDEIHATADAPLDDDE